MPTGKIYIWKPDRGFGFIRPDDGSHDVFCHVSGFQNRMAPNAGDRVEYDTRLSPRVNKPEAFDIRLIA